MKLNAKEFNMPPRYWKASMGDLLIPEEYHKEINDWIKNPKNMLILIGTPGTGKTHLCAAILNDFWCKKEVRFFRDDDLYMEAKKAVGRNHDGCQEILYKCETKYLIIDDFGVGDTTSYRIQCTERLIDFRYSQASTSATIITTNRSAIEIKEKYSDRIASRMFAQDNKVIILEGYNLR